MRTLEIRKNEHYRVAEVSQEHRVHRGVYSLLCSGIHPAIEEIEHGLGEGRHECEKFWIAFYKLMGCDLWNETAGGQGTIGWARHNCLKPARKSHC